MRYLILFAFIVVSNFSYSQWVVSAGVNTLSEDKAGGAFQVLVKPSNDYRYRHNYIFAGIGRRTGKWTPYMQFSYFKKDGVVARSERYIAFSSVSSHREIYEAKFGFDYLGLRIGGDYTFHRMHDDKIFVQIGPMLQIDFLLSERESDHTITIVDTYNNVETEAVYEQTFDAVDMAGRTTLIGGQLAMGYDFGKLNGRISLGAAAHTVGSRSKLSLPKPEFLKHGSGLFYFTLGLGVEYEFGAGAEEAPLQL